MNARPSSRLRSLPSADDDRRPGQPAPRKSLILVVCGRPNSVTPNGPLCLDGEYSHTPNPALTNLLRAVDRAGELAGTNQEVGGCEVPSSMR